MKKLFIILMLLMLVFSPAFGANYTQQLSVKYNSSMYMDVYTPASPKGVVIYCHPSGQTRKINPDNIWVQEALNNNYTIATIDFRHIYFDNYEGDTIDAVNYFKSKGYTKIYFVAISLGTVCFMENINNPNVEGFWLIQAQTNYDDYWFADTFNYYEQRFKKHSDGAIQRVSYDSRPVNLIYALNETDYVIDRKHHPGYGSELVKEYQKYNIDDIISISYGVKQENYFNGMSQWFNFISPR